MQRVDSYRIIGPDYELFASQTSHSSSGTQVAEALRQFALAHHINIGVSRPDLTRPEDMRHFYLAVGDKEEASTRWLRHGYPGFTHEVQTRTHDIGEADTIEPGGFYYVFGGLRQAKDLRALLAQLGFKSSIEPFMSLHRAHEWLWGGALKWCVVIVLAAVVALVGLGVFLNSKYYAVQRLNGRSSAQIYARDLVHLGRFLLIAITIGAIGGTAVMWSYNRLHHLVALTLVTTGLASLLMLVALAAHAGSLTLIQRISVLGAIKGEIPAGWLVFGAYVLRTAAITIAFLVAISGLALWNRIDGLRISQNQWAANRNTVRVTLNGTLGEKLDREAKDVGHWLRQEDQAGRIILSVRQELRDFPPSGAPAAYGEVLKVNQAYLAHQPVLLASGKAASARSDEVQVLIPPVRDSTSTGITAGVTEWVKFSAALNKIRPPKVTFSEMASGQHIFSYGSGSAIVGNPMMLDPVVIVLPRNATLLRDEEYSSYATLASVIFPDSSTVTAARRDKRMAAYINGVQPINRRAIQEYRDVVRDFRFHLIDLGITFAVLIITAAGICIAFCRKNGARIYAQFINGWPLLRTYRWLLGSEVAAALLATAWVGWDTISKLDYKEAGIPESMPPTVSDAIGSVSGWEPAVIAIIGLMNISFSLIALSALNRGIVRKGAANA